MQGLKTVTYAVSDINQAKEWYNKVFETTPYFDEPFYVGYNIEGYELGLLPNPKKHSPKQDSVVAYWGTSNIKQELKRLQLFSVEIHDPVENVGGEILLATVLDPFGNTVGLIENPEFKLD